MKKFNSRYKALLGPAGSGKSYTLRELVKEDYTFGFLTSSTGIAAVNIGGTTINHALGYFDTRDMFDSVVSGAINAKLMKIARTYDNLIIEECGMLPAQQLNLIVHCIEKIKDRLNKEFGLLLVGDPGQLPPVNKVGPNTDPKFYSRPFFESNYWNLFEIQELTEIKRQSDPEFIYALQMIRAGRVAEVANWFEKEVGFHYKLDDDFQGSTILPTNKAVDRFNAQALEKLPGFERESYKETGGVLLPEWKGIQDVLTIKEGALVTLTSNNLDADYANGDLAEVVDVYTKGGEDSTVYIKGKPEVVRGGPRLYLIVKVRRTGKLITLTDKKIENLEEDPKNKEAYRPIGFCRFLPCKLAYASTIHRAQGLTLDAVQIRMDSFFSQLSGGLYTALSRCRTKEGLRLVGSKESFIRACYVEDRYLPWVSNIAAYAA